MKKLNGKILIFFLIFVFSFLKSSDIEKTADISEYFIKKEEKKRINGINTDNIKNKKTSHATKKNISANSFFAKNRKKQNVIEIKKDCLQYRVISSGNGRHISLYNSFLISIEGKFLDNSVFLSKYKFVTSLEDLPLFIYLAVEKMQENEIRQIFVNPDFIEKESFFLPKIFPFSILIYEIKILKNDKSKIYQIENSLAKKYHNLR